MTLGEIDWTGNGIHSTSISFTKSFSKGWHHPCQDLLGWTYIFTTAPYWRGTPPCQDLSGFIKTKSKVQWASAMGKLLCAEPRKFQVKWALASPGSHWFIVECQPKRAFLIPELANYIVLTWVYRIPLASITQHLKWVQNCWLHMLFACQSTCCLFFMGAHCMRVLVYLVIFHRSERNMRGSNPTEDPLVGHMTRIKDCSLILSYCFIIGDSMSWKLWCQHIPSVFSWWLCKKAQQ